MNRSLGIQRWIALALMLVITIASTPKAYVHDLVADHHDDPGCTINHHTVVLHQHQVDCGFDDLVVPVPFVVVESQSFDQLYRFHQRDLSFYSSFPVSSPALHYESRGPPLS